MDRIIIYQQNIKRLSMHLDMHVGYLMSRRETWIETVSRFSNFMQGHLDKNLGVVLDSEVWRRIEDNIIIICYAIYESIDDCRTCIRKRKYSRI